MRTVFVLDVIEEPEAWKEVMAEVNKLRPGWDLMWTDGATRQRRVPRGRRRSAQGLLPRRQVVRVHRGPPGRTRTARLTAPMLASMVQVRPPFKVSQLGMLQEFPQPSSRFPRKRC